MSDRTSKKLKLFFDGSQKVKHRLAALLAFLESAPEAEQQRIYRENADIMATFVVECFNYTLEKLGTDKEYYGKFERALQRDHREIEEIFKAPFLLERVLRLLRHELSTMTQTDQLINIIRVLLHPGNAVALRRQGMRLLMFWLREEGDRCPFPDLLTLFASAVPLKLFISSSIGLTATPLSTLNTPMSSASSSSLDGLNRPMMGVEIGPAILLDQVSFPLVHDEEPPLLASSIAMDEREQALAMLTSILDYITYDPDADRRSTLFLYGLLKGHYLSKLYPRICSEEITSNRPLLEIPFYEACPAPIQAIIMRYYAMWITQDAELFLGLADGSSAPGGLPVATFILQEIIMNSPPGDRELVHEILAQSLRLPPTYKSVVRLALGMLRGWIFTGRERRPEFLLKAKEEEGEFDEQLLRYISMVGAVFQPTATSLWSSVQSGGSSIEVDQADLYREAIYFFRGMAMKVFFIPQRATWDALLSMLLDLCESHLGGIHGGAGGGRGRSPTSTSTFANPPLSSATSPPPPSSTSPLLYPRLLDGGKLADEFSQLLTETLFGTLIRAEYGERQWWERLSRILAMCTRWKPVVEEWTKVIYEVTELMIKNVLIPTGNNKVGSDGEFVRRKPLKSGAFESGPGLADGSLFTRAILSSMGPLTGGKSSNTSLTHDSFRKWIEAPWTRENVVFLWRNLLRALGDINAISVPANHELAIECLCRITDRLRLLRDHGVQPYVWRPLPPIYECVSWLLDACDLPARTFAPSRCLAYGCLGRLFFRRLDLAPPPAFLVRYYLALVNGLSDKDDPAASVILASGATELFGFSFDGLPGSTLLVPSILKCVAALLNAPIPRDSDRALLLVPMMRMAANLAVLPAALFPTLTFPRIEAPLPIMSAIPITCAGEMDLGTLRLQARDFLLLLDAAQEGVRADLAVHATWLAATTTAILGECLSSCTSRLTNVQSSPPGSETTLLDSYLDALLEHLLPFRDGPVLTAIHDQFYALAHIFPLMDANNIFTEERQTMIIQRLITALYHYINPTTFLMGEDVNLMVSRSLSTLLEWLMVLPPSWLSMRHHLREQLFSLLEDACKHTSPRIRSATEFFLVHLHHHLGNFSPVPGGATLSSTIDEYDYDEDGVEVGAENEKGKLHGRSRKVYVSVGGDTTTNGGCGGIFESAPTILAIQQRPEGKVRIVARNLAGKFTWEAQSFYGITPEDQNIYNETVNMTTLPLASNHDEAVTADEMGNTKKFEGLPYYPTNGTVNLEKTDMLQELLVYLEEEHKEPIGGPISENLPNIEDSINEMSEICAAQTAAEQSVAASYKCHQDNLSGSSAMMTHPPATSPVPLGGMAGITPFATARQWMANWGFLDPLAPVSLKVLAKTAALRRDLEGLDQLSARETIKVAVLYVAPGQEDELSILRNGPSTISRAYEEFVRGLGWKVNLARHAGYRGGLDARSTYHGKATYYASSTVECVFHESAFLLSTEDKDKDKDGATTDSISDNKFIAKKRHIGNDHVHIIWNEHYREYRAASTIRTEFANAQIVITPIAPSMMVEENSSDSDGLEMPLMYRINIWREVGVPVFGPLYDGAVIPPALLAPLVRVTAINAHRAVVGTLLPTTTNTLTTSLPTAPSNPLANRTAELHQLVERHAQDGWTMDQFLSYVMFANNPLPQETTISVKSSHVPSDTDGIERIAVGVVEESTATTNLTTALGEMIL